MSKFTQMKIIIFYLLGASSSSIIKLYFLDIFNPAKIDSTSIVIQRNRLSCGGSVNRW